MPINPKKFWVVWCLDGDAPTVRHTTYKMAAEEAKRLARAHQDEQFVVLEAKTIFCVHSVEIIDLDEEEIPF